MEDRIFVALARRSGVPSTIALRRCRTVQLERRRAGETDLTLFAVACQDGTLDAAAARRFEAWAEQVARGSSEPIVEASRVLYRAAGEVGTDEIARCPRCRALLDDVALVEGRAYERAGKRECLACASAAPSSGTPDDRLFVLLARRAGYPPEAELRRCRTLQLERRSAGEPVSLFQVARDEDVLESAHVARFLSWTRQVQKRAAEPIVEEEPEEEAALVSKSAEERRRILYERARDVGTDEVPVCPHCKAFLDEVALVDGRAREVDGRRVCVACTPGALGRIAEPASAPLADTVFVALARKVGYPSMAELRGLRARQWQDGRPLFEIAREGLSPARIARFERWADQVARGAREPIVAEVEDETGSTTAEVRVLYKSSVEVVTAAPLCERCDETLDGAAISGGTRVCAACANRPPTLAEQRAEIVELLARQETLARRAEDRDRVLAMREARLATELAREDDFRERRTRFGTIGDPREFADRWLEDLRAARDRARTRARLKPIAFLVLGLLALLAIQLTRGGPPPRPPLAGAPTPPGATPAGPTPTPAPEVPHVAATRPREAPAHYFPVAGITPPLGPRVSVDPSTGFATLFEDDGSLGEAEPCLALRRARTMGDATPGAFGAGWRFELAARLEATGDSLIVERIEGWRRFVPVATREGKRVLAAAVGDAEVVIESASGYELFAADGRDFRFSRAGELTAIVAGERTVELSRSQDGLHVKAPEGELVLASDAQGRITKVTGALSVAYSYGPEGELLEVAGPKPRGYEASGKRVTSVRTGDRELLALTFDASGRLASLASATGERRVYQFDEVTAGVRRLQRCALADESGTTTILEDASGAVVSGEGGSATYLFDERGRITGEARDGAVAGKAPRERTASVIAAPEDSQPELTLDEVGRPVAARIAGRALRWSYDENGLLAAKDGPEGSVAYVRDLRGRVIAHVDSSGATRIGRDEDGRVTELASPGGRVWRFGWEGETLTSANGPWGDVHYEHGPGGAVSRRTVGTESLVVKRDEARGLSSLEGRDAVLTIRADDLGRPAEATARVGSVTRVLRWRRESEREYAVEDERGALTYTTSPEGRIVKIASPWGVVTPELTDGLVSSLESPAGKFTFERDPSGLILGTLYPNGVVAKTAYDRGARVADTASLAGENLLALRYERGADGLRTSTTRDGDTTSYSFEDGRLVAVRGGWGARRYTFDLDGNRLADGPPDALALSSFDNLGRLETREDADAEHDEAGRLVRLKRPTGEDVFRYDGLGRLARVERAGSPAVDYAYDPLGRLARRTVGERATELVYDRDRLVAELEGGEVARLWVHGPLSDQPLAFRERGHWFYLHANDRGDVVAYTDEKGARVAAVELDPWGLVVGIRCEPSSGLEPATLPIFFAGRRYDPTARLYDMRARFYDPELARFLTPDPLGPDASLNAYAYTSGNPLDFVDVEGTQEENKGLLAAFWGGVKEFASETSELAVGSAEGLGYLVGLKGMQAERAAARQASWDDLTLPRLQSRFLAGVDVAVENALFGFVKPGLKKYALDPKAFDESHHAASRAVAVANVVMLVHTAKNGISGLIKNRAAIGAAARGLWAGLPTVRGLVVAGRAAPGVLGRAALAAPGAIADAVRAAPGLLGRGIRAIPKAIRSFYDGVVVPSTRIRGTRWAPKPPPPPRLNVRDARKLAELRKAALEPPIEPHSGAAQKLNPEAPLGEAGTRVGAGPGPVEVTPGRGPRGPPTGGAEKRPELFGAVEVAPETPLVLRRALAREAALRSAREARIAVEQAVEAERSALDKIIVPGVKTDPAAMAEVEAAVRASPKGLAADAGASAFARKLALLSAEDQRLVLQELASKDLPRGIECFKSGPYAARLFPGAKLVRGDGHFWAVLPDGRIVDPAMFANMRDLGLLKGAGEIVEGFSLNSVIYEPGQHTKLVDLLVEAMRKKRNFGGLKH